ncbi:DUF6192 family protein [Kitasatospora sp. NPDC087861]|uniref:DUF6192 family protein n=1 Tax=Kitasatospora sp. NPDC087861 TaxID=3364070 RepID=UPI00380FFC76
MSELVGAVSLQRYDELVAEGRDLVEQMRRCQFRIGDIALEIAPMRQVGGHNPSLVEGLSTVTSALERFAADIGLTYKTVETYRWTSSRWPAGHRQVGVSHTVHKILASVEEDRRLETILAPPMDERTGAGRWTPDSAKRVLGWHVDTPVTVQEKIEQVHDLVADETVAAQVATDLLRRPSVAFKAMTDTTARHLVNRAQVEHAQQVAEVTHVTAAEAVNAPVPLLHQIQSTMQFVDLIGACSAFVAQIGRIVPSLRGHVFTDDERATVERNLARVRGASDWVESAVTTGNAGLDEALAALLRGE